MIVGSTGPLISNCDLFEWFSINGNAHTVYQYQIRICDILSLILDKGIESAEQVPNGYFLGSISEVFIIDLIPNESTLDLGKKQDNMVIVVQDYC